MSVWMAAAVVVAAVVAGVAYAVSSAEMADAQRDVAETNARATIQAAREAANAQIESAKYDAQARMHDADMAYKQEQEYIKSEKWFALNELDDMSYQQSRWNELDEISVEYASVEGTWGTGPECGYDYGYDA